MVMENMWNLYNKAMDLQKWLSGPGDVDPNMSGPTEKQPNGPSHADATYITWLKEHPCALTSFQEMMSATEGKQIVVFLDYDGTLSPIVNDPERAFMSDAMRSAVREVARRFPTAIISGRSRDKVYGFVKLDEVYYAGSHGMDIMGPPAANSHDNKYQTNTMDPRGNEITIFQPAKEYLPAINKMLAEVKERTCDIAGVFVEDNRFCISVHYRHVLEEDYPSLKGIIENLLSHNYTSFHLTQGKKVLEIRPSIKWNKGNALEYLLETIRVSDSTNVLPFYIGDDKTDEDAFKVN
ncbi:hypothetical protein ACS0TY_000009 [Phlomoides rotata]